LEFRVEMIQPYERMGQLHPLHIYSILLWIQAHNTEDIQLLHGYLIFSTQNKWGWGKDC